MEALAMSEMVSVNMQKYGVMPTYLIGRDRWDPTIYSSVNLLLYMRNYTDRVSSMCTQIRMWMMLPGRKFPVARSCLNFSKSVQRTRCFRSNA